MMQRGEGPLRHTFRPLDRGSRESDGLQASPWRQRRADGPSRRRGNATRQRLRARGSALCRSSRQHCRARLAARCLPHATPGTPHDSMFRSSSAGSFRRMSLLVSTSPTPYAPARTATASTPTTGVGTGDALAPDPRGVVRGRLSPPTQGSPEGCTSPACFPAFHPGGCRPHPRTLGMHCRAPA